MFVDPDGDDDLPGTEDDNVRLSPGSPCIDAANNATVPIDASTDLDGELRAVDNEGTPDCPQAIGTCGIPPVVDMGAFEVQVSTPLVPTVSEWGMVAMTLLVLTAGTIVHVRRRPIHP